MGSVAQIDCNMKTRLNFLRQSKEKGQSLVEFVLLLVVISGISYGFVSLINRNLSRYWVFYADLIVNDDANKKTVRLR